MTSQMVSKSPEWLSTQPTTRSPHPGMDNSPRVLRDLKTFRRRSSPRQTCGASTIAISCSSVYIHLFNEGCAYLMPHQTLLVLHRARIPSLKVCFAALAPAHRRKVEEDGGEASFGCRVLSRELTQQKELLGSRILNRRKRACAEVHPKL